MAREDLLGRFFHHPQRQNDGTYKDVIYVEIRVKGDRNTTFSRPKIEDDEEDFPGPWKAFKKSQPEEINGTPVSALPRVTESDRLNLAEMGVYTVEDLAALNDQAISNIKMGHDVRRRAKAYMAAMAEEPDESEEPQGETGGLELITKRKPGRPRKIEEA